MIRKVFHVISILIAFIAQTTVVAALPLSAKPQLVFCIVVFIGLLAGSKSGMLLGFLGGILVDIYYGDVLGYYALMYIVAGYVCGKYCKLFFEDKIWLPMISVFSGDVIMGLIIYASRFFLRGRVYLPGYIYKVILPEAVMSAILTLIIYKLFYALDALAHKADERRRHSSWLQE